MSEHTKGPWKVVEGYYPGFLEVSGPSFKISIVTSATDIDFNDYVSRIADAKLIAAAPDLLEALIMCCQSMSRVLPDFNPSDQAAYDIARAALAKVKGEN